MLSSYICMLFCSVQQTVLKRCVSGLPTDECPFIPKQYLQQLLLRRNARGLESSSSLSESPFSSPSATPTNVFDKIESLAQVEEPAIQCEERRQLGQQLLIEKVQKVDSMLSRFVGNFISHFSNSTNSEEVNIFFFLLRMFKCSGFIFIHFLFRCCVRCYSFIFLIHLYWLFCFTTDVVLDSKRKGEFHTYSDKWLQYAVAYALSMFCVALSALKLQIDPPLEFHQQFVHWFATHFSFKTLHPIFIWGIRTNVARNYQFPTNATGYR